MLKTLHRATAAAFPKSVAGNKIQACTQKSDEPVHEYYNGLQIIFIENSDIPSDIHSAQVALKSMFINRLNGDSSVLLKGDQDRIRNCVQSRFS